MRPMIALLLVSLTALALALVLGLSRSPRADASGADFRESYIYAKTFARRYRLQRDDLQRRLVRRVVEVRKLRERIGELVRAKAAPRRDVAYAIHLAATVYGVSESDMHSVASCESGHSSTAVNGQYRGVYQEGPMFERGPFGRAGFSVWDAVPNALTAAWTVSREGWSQWSCKP